MKYLLNYLKTYKILKNVDNVLILLSIIISLFCFNSNSEISEFYLFILYIFLPGYLIYRNLFSRQLPKLLIISYSVGFSIVFIYLISLINIILSEFFITQLPLDRPFLYASFIVGVLIFFCYKITRQKSDFVKLKYISTSNSKYISILNYALPLIPILSVFGAILLNNYSSNILSITIYSIIFLIFIFYFFKSDLINDSHVANFILAASLALIFSYSFRSNFISGYDISQEFKFFKITLSTLNWLPKDIVDAYQACLSITVLPTVIATFSPFTNEYIFKFIMTSFISLIPVNLYYLNRNFFTKKISITAIFFFISQYWYIAQLPTILRQGIGYLFYSLILLTIFSNKPKLKKNVVLVLLGIGLILSHYSTTYIFLTILVLLKIFIFCLTTCRFNKFYSKLSNKVKIGIVNRINLFSDISFLTVIVLILFAYIWYIPVTNTFPNLISKFGIDKSEELNHSYTHYLEKIKDIFTYKFDSNNNIANINHFLHDQKNTLLDKRPYLYNSEYEKEIIILDETTYIPKKVLLPLSFLPSILIKTVNNTFIMSRTLLNNILLPIGVVVVIFFNNKLNLQFVFFSLFILGQIILITLLPKGLGSYNIERLYLQLLMSSSGIMFWLFFCIKRIIKYKSVVHIIIILVVGIYYFFYTGVGQSIIGGNPLMTLNNFGNDFYKTYTHKSEVYSAKWIKPYLNNEFIFADNPGRNRLLAYTEVEVGKVITPIIATTLNHSSYVFLNYHNNVENLVITSVNGKDIYLSTPRKTLNYNKDLLYSNGETQIYK